MLRQLAALQARSQFKSFAAVAGGARLGGVPVLPAARFALPKGLGLSPLTAVRVVNGNVVGVSRVALRTMSTETGVAAEKAKAEAAAAAEKAGAEEAATAGAAEGQAAGEKDHYSGEAPAEEGAEYIDEPIVAKISRWVVFAIKMAFGLGFTGIILYAGYTIVSTLLPGGASANAIMRRATDVLKSDPEIVQYFGSNIKTYGEDFGARNEGRRYFVRDYEYTDDLTDVAYHRVKFTLEGDRGRKAHVWAEVRQGSYDFRYLIVLTKDQTRVWSVVDNRPIPPSVEERQARVTSLLQEAGWPFYADNELDIKEQKAVLGDYWLKVRCVRCDEDPKRCEEAGVIVTPSWMTERGPMKGVKDLHGLEVMVKPIAKSKTGAAGFFASLFGSSSKPATA